MEMPNNGIHAAWKYMYDDIPACSHCGIGAPFARYKRKNGINARDLTNYCPNCGALMDKIKMCKDCDWSDKGNKNWGVVAFVWTVTWESAMNIIG